MKKTYIKAILLGTLIVFAGLMILSPQAQAIAKQPFEWIFAKQLTVSGMAQFERIDIARLNTTTTLTDALTWTPRAGLEMVQANTTVTLTALGDGDDIGHVVVVLNTSSNSIVIPDAANTDLGGSNVTLGENDSLMLLWDGDDWLKQYLANN